MQRLRLSTTGVLPILALLGMLVPIWTGCGSDSSNGGGGNNPTMTANEQLDEGVTGLSTFGVDTLNDPNFSFLLSEQVQGLAGEIFGGLLNQGVGLAVLASTGQVTRSLQQSAQLLRVEQGFTKKDLSDDFGTYDRDANDVTEPYPGWVLADAENPSNGLIFRFDGEDDVYLENELGEPIVAEGEIRLVDVAVETLPTEGGGTEEVPTAFVFEIEAGPVGVTPVKFFRMKFDMTLTDGMPSSLSIGDFAAATPDHPGASFFGDLFFAADMSLEDGELSAGLQLFDDASDYVIAVGAQMAGVDLEDPDATPTSLGFQFAFGSTPNPTQPPYVFDVLLDNYQVVEEETIADVSGNVFYNGSNLASLSGDTSTVTVEVDGELEDCPNVDITFADDPTNPVNLCVGLEALLDILDLSGNVLKMALR